MPADMIPLATELFTATESAHLLRSFLRAEAGSTRTRLSLMLHHSLHRSALRLAATGEVGGDDPWLDAIASQIAKDAADQVFVRWGRSTVVDDNTRAPVLPRGYFEWLHERAGLISDWPVGNAGLLHTYGYLLSAEWTPYGWKRERWVDGELATWLGLDPRMLAPIPHEGTLLGNLTAALTEIVSGDDPSLPRAGIELVEHADGSPAFVTRLFGASSDGGRALVYSVKSSDVTSEELWISAFPVRVDYARELLDGSSSAIPLRAKYNAAYGGPWDVDVRRSIRV